MLEPNENAYLLSDLLKKIDEKKPEKETLAQVDSSFCLNKNKIAEFTQSLSAMRTKLSGLAKGTFVAPLLGMTDSGEISPKTKLAPQCPRALTSLKRRSFTSFGMTDVGEVAHTAQPKSVGEAVFAKPKKVAAFTLAEVLVTLGIIGIVAAMTLPNLIANYKNLVLSTQLKKVVTTMDNGARMLLANEGVDYLADTSLFGFGTRDRSKRLVNLDVFEKHFKLTPLSKSSKFVQDIGGSVDDSVKYYFSQEGACYGIISVNNHDWNESFMAVDINCDKGPNKWGYDRYYLIYGLDLVADFPKATTIFNDYYKAFLHEWGKMSDSEFRQLSESVKETCKGNTSEDCEGALAELGLFIRYLDGWNIKW